MTPAAHFVAIGMRKHVDDPDALVINTCSGNGTAALGDLHHWVWANPTNTAVTHPYHDIEAVSVECLWQGTKIQDPAGMTERNRRCLAGDWRMGKGKRPLGSYAGPNQPWITSPGEARRRIYIPAFDRLVQYWLVHGARPLLQLAHRHPGTVYLRDHDTGQGIDRNGPMSHAWLLSVWLNTGAWPS
jgi:hypothetical protein